MTWAKTTTSSTKRGYGAAHRKLRDALLPKAYGTPCCICGYLMLEGQKLHLDHNPQRTGYRGMAHAACNLKDAARRARAIQIYKTKINTAHRW